MNLADYYVAEFEGTDRQQKLAVFHDDCGKLIGLPARGHIQVDQVLAAIALHDQKGCK